MIIKVARDFTKKVLSIGKKAVDVAYHSRVSLLIKYVGDIA